MSVWHRAYLYLGWHLNYKEEYELVKYLRKRSYELYDNQEEVKLDCVDDCMCARYFVIGKKIQMVASEDENKFFNVELPKEKDYSEVVEILKEKYEVDLGRPELFMFSHGD